MKANDRWMIGFVLSYILKNLLIILASAFLFFDSVLGVIILFPYVIYLFFKFRKKYRKKAGEVMVIQFRDTLGCMQTAMEAGETIEKSITLAKKDMEVMYGKGAAMVLSLEKMERRLDLSENIEDIIEDFANETDVKEIINFSDVFSVAKRSGGNILQLIRAATSDMYEKIEMKREIDGIIAANRNECMIMRLMPLGILAYFKLFSSSFISFLYDNSLGKLIMIAVAVLYFGLSEYGENIIDGTESMI